MKLNKKIAFIICSIILVLIGFIIYNHFSSADDNNITGKVISEDAAGSSKNQGGSLVHSKVSVKITSGSHKNEIVQVDNLVNDKTYHENVASIGDQVLLSIDENDNGTIKSANIYEIVRYNYIYMLIFIFIILLGIVGGIKGLKSIAALFLTGVVIIKILIPLILKGFNPIVVSLVLCIGVSIINLLIISGKNRKTLAAIIGTVGGVVVAAVIGLSMSSVLRLTGLTDEELQMIVYVSQNAAFDYRGLLFSGILMGALGAVMDISMSIASAVNEIKSSSGVISKKELIKSGMNVGRDIMGTMANTLILAYVGGSMYTLMLVSTYSISLNRILDQDVIASEILKSLAGSIGLVFTIPITAVAAAMLLAKNNKNFQNKSSI